jgi:ABC-type spermidine/putrescine transport system permease subunit II
VIVFINVSAIAASAPSVEKRRPTSCRPLPNVQIHHVLLLRTALLAGGLLAFALSFDEIIVTTFTAGSGIQTLPIWIFANYQRPNNLPLVNVAALFVLVLSIVPVYLASRLTEDTSGVSGRR